MKTCPTCKAVYRDEEINFCLADGTTLIEKKGKNTKRSHRNDVVAVIVAAVALLVMLSLITASTTDRSLFSTGDGSQIRNWIGPIGANIAAVLFNFFGYAAYIFPFLIALIAWRVYQADTLVPRPLRVAGFVLFVVSLAGLLSLFFGPRAGAATGEMAAQGVGHFIGSIGAGVLLTAVFISSVLLVTNFTIEGFMSHFDLAWENVRIRFDEWRERRRAESPSMIEAKRRAEKRRSKRELQDEVPSTIRVPDIAAEPIIEPTIDEGPSIPTVPAPEQSYETLVADDPLATTPGGVVDDENQAVEDLVLAETEPESDDAEEPVPDDEPEASKRNNYDNYQYPRPEMLTPPAPRIQQDDDELRAIARELSQKAGEFNVGGSVMNISKGPVVTTYEFKPDAGVRYSRVTNLADDLCLALKAESIRIDRIPGKAYVGIEVPNRRREVINLREVIESPEFEKSNSLLTLALGKTIGGLNYVNDLAKMPHLLIAGATGAGKSVGVNTLVMSILYKARPDEVKFIMVDPKRLELGLYKDIPHLAVPIITEPKKAANALKWAVTEMERRYRDLAGYGVRNIDGYNAEMRRRRDLELTDHDGNEPRILPYVVIIIDELADLMMVAGKDVEESITRLAQMARAVGIHLVLATQRPSVDVITGLIKANFPSRIAFRVSSKVDSRTIIDGNGAESLLGQGDMLFLPPGNANVIRIHGAFVNEAEIKKVVDHIKGQGSPEYDQTITVSPEETADDGDLPGRRDPIFDDALRVFVSAKRASTSLLQRNFKVGYGRAAGIIDAMVREGFIGEMDGAARARPILEKAYEYLQDLEEGAAGDLDDRP